MLELLDAREGQTVLDVGSGSPFLVTGLVCLVGVLPWLRAPEPLTLQDEGSPHEAAQRE